MYLKSVQVASSGFIVNGNDDRLNEKVKLGGALNAVGISARQIMTCG